MTPASVPVRPTIAVMTTPVCYPCGKEAQFDALPPRECISFDQDRRVAHSFNTALPG
jgi:hypothetical protein